MIFFRCNPRYVPAGRMSGICASANGISVVGTWTPDPADLVCNGKRQQVYKACHIWKFHIMKLFHV